MIHFPSQFLWGAATAAYQVEGGNANADWWPWELGAGKEPSGEACRHYSLYEQDFDLARELHHNAHRLSVEWSRIEPEEGKFSDEALTHYKAVLQALHGRGIEPMVTLHHFTSPIWFSSSGGWADRRAVSRFLRFVNVVVQALQPQVRYWVTINEPTVYISHSFMWGIWPPQEKSYWKALRVHDNMIRAHIDAYRLIHQIYAQAKALRPFVSLSQHIQAMVPCAPTLKNRAAVRLRDWACNFEILDQLARHKTLDFIGVNYYSRQRVDVSSWWIGNLLTETCQKNHDPVSKNALGWDIYPDGLYQVLMKLKKYDVPVVITENGICTADDAQRWEFITAHLKSVRRAMDEGVRVAGYLYWSLIDNFEWDKGFGPRFGMIAMDYRTFKRTVHDSARRFAKVCATGTLDV